MPPQILLGYRNRLGASLVFLRTFRSKLVAGGFLERHSSGVRVPRRTIIFLHTLFTSTHIERIRLVGMEDFRRIAAP
jgi:hypothetical protein